VALLSAGCSDLVAAEPHARPHVVLIVAEDLGPRIGAFGDPIASTPRIDTLAREGVRYPNTFTTAGVCAPSRAALITGRHQNTIGAQHMRASTHPGHGYRSVPPPDVKAFPEHLRAGGYYTTVDQKLDYQFSGILVGSGPFTIWDDEGADAGWRDRPEGTPFFAMFNPAETHESGVFTPLGSMPHSAVHFAMQLLRAWQFGWDVGTGGPDPASLPLPPYYPDTQTVRSDLARHYSNIAHMDAHVGRILDRLEADGVLEDTIVIFTTDHGDGLPRAKRELYDSGLKVPLIVRWPERWRPQHLPPGSTDPQLVSFVDLAPTILAMASVPKPASLPGRDFVANTTPPRPFVFAARDRIDEVEDRQRAARGARFKYIRSLSPEIPGGHTLDFRDNLAMVREMRNLHREGRLDEAQARWFEPPGPERLFDLRNDPHELVDLSRDPAHGRDLERLRAALDAWLLRSGETPENLESEMAERFWPGGREPATASPRLRETANGVEITCASPGASIGYRVDAGRWQLYTKPIRLQPGQTLEARAVRYGWAQSDTARFEPGNDRAR